MVVAGTEGESLATRGLEGGRASVPRVTSVRPDPLLSKRMGVGWDGQYLGWSHKYRSTSQSPSKGHPDLTLETERQPLS